MGEEGDCTYRYTVTTRRWGKRETVPIARLSPPGGGGRGRLYLSLHCHHQEVGEGGDCTYRYTVTTRRWGKGETVPIATLSHHNDSCIKTGIDEFHFYVSEIVRDKVTTVSTDHNFSREKRAEAESNRGPSAYQPPNPLPLGHVGSHLQRPTFRFNVVLCPCTETIRTVTDGGPRTAISTFTQLLSSVTTSDSNTRRFVCVCVCGGGGGGTSPIARSLYIIRDSLRAQNEATVPSPLCPCCLENQTAERILQTCPSYNMPRKTRWPVENPLTPPPPIPSAFPPLQQHAK